MMNINRKFWLFIYVVSFGILIWGISAWTEAYRYTPKIPEKVPLNLVSFKITAREFPLTRYQELIDGGLFFEKIVVPVAEVKHEFKSRLVIYGLVKGKDCRAIVGVEGNPAETWIVKPGIAVQGEKIITVGADYLVVKNESGEGKVFFRK